MELLVVLVISTPVVLAVWLTVRAVRAKAEIAELTYRVDELQEQVRRLGKPAPAPEAVQPEAPAFRPAVLPPRKEETLPSTPPEPPTPIIFPPEIKPPAVPQPDTLPPIIPDMAFRPQPQPEPVFENAQVAEESSPEPEHNSFEMRLGTYWLVRAGIVMLLAGLGFFANYAYYHIIGKLGPAGKISLLYLASGLLLGAGAWWQRRGVKESLKNYAQVLFAGGLAAVYFTTYAAHHIPPLCVIGSAVLDGTLLLAWAGVIAWIADRRKSEVMALFAIGLAFFTSVITRVGDFTLYSNLVLTVAAVVFLLRNRWISLSFAGLATSYAGYTFWRFLHDDGWRWAAPDERLNFGASFLAAYWLVFTAATFLARGGKISGVRRAAFLSLNNGAAFSLFLLTMFEVHTGGFWKIALGFGSVLLTLAALAKKTFPDEPPAKNAYLTQGILLVTLGTIAKFAGFQLALMLGAESVALYILATQRQSLVLKFFAYAAAVLATGWCLFSLDNHDAHGVLAGTTLGALLVFNAFWAHRKNLGNSEPLRAEPMSFTLLTFANWLATTCFNTSAEHLPLTLAAEAMALTFSIYLLRVREITLLGQFFLIFAQLAWLSHFLNATPPWWNPLGLIAVTVGLSHWWQHQKIFTVSRNIFIGYSTIFALAAVAVVFVWLHPLVSPPAWLALTSLLAVAATIYGVATRAWPLAVCGQIFLAVSTVEFVGEIFHDKPEWYFPLVPLAALATLSFATVGWFARHTDGKPEVRNPLLQTALVYRWLALVMSLLWICQYVPERPRAGAFMLAAAAVFALAVWRRNREALLATAVYAVAALGGLWLHDDLEMDVYWVNFVSLIALLAMQQTLRRAGEKLLLDEKIHGAVIFLGGVSLWRLLSCWVATGGVFLTMTWAGFAVAVFALGMFLRERFHRWLGLGVLAAAVGRVVLVDVWKQETIWRVVTFLALGVALLVVGFIYNKYQDTIRKWL
jgi:uncharacterized membrane protein